MFKIKLKNIFIIFLLVANGLSVSSVSSMIPDLGDAHCASLLLVSSWTRDNVKIYDGCSGAFIRDLDSQNLIDGPLSLLEAPDGDLLVVSETNGRLLKFDRQTLSVGSVVMGDDPATTEIENNFITNPVGAIIDDNGLMYAASYSLNSVVKINTQSWTIIDEMLPANNNHIKGIDAGMTISDDGYLYLPGYDSDNIIKLNLTTKAVTNVVAAATGGLNAPRTILLRGQELIVTAERSNAVMVFDLSTGAFKQKLIDIVRPTGMQQDGDSHLLINNANAVFQITNDGSAGEKIVQNDAGDLAGGTFVYRLQKTGLDNDNDGLNNEDESNIHGTDPENPDTDDDNLSDGDEVNTHGTNPLLKDTDGDGMPDDYEVTYSLLAKENDAAADPDADGLSNLEEYQTGTLPNKDDTDGDGEKDSVDANPLIPNTAPEISGMPETSVEQNATYRFVPQVGYVGDLSTISLSISNKPDWANFDQVNGELTGTPDNSHVGVSSGITITASNGYHHVDMNRFDLEVININDAPVLTSNIPEQKLIVGDRLFIDLTNYFNDIDRDDSLTFSAEGLPTGIMIDNQGLISGLVSVEGQSQVKVTATDLSQTVVKSDFNINVQAKAKSSGGGANGLAWIALIALLLFYKKQSIKIINTSS